MNPTDQELLEVTLHAARKASQFIIKESQKIQEVDFKGATDLVTQADRLSEHIIVREIDKHFPDHSILTEESGGRSNDSPFAWIVDPLDGTTNFVHGYPFYAVSVAVHHNGKPLVGVVVDVFHGHTYSAVAGKGTFRNGKRIRVSNTSTLGRSLLATGFPYVHDEIWARNMVWFKEFTDIAQGVRRGGSAAIDLCHVACGWLDGFWEAGLHPWDTAAGILIVKEAGGVISRMDGKPFSIFDIEIVASNGHLHDEIVQIFKSHDG